MYTKTFLFAFALFCLIGCEKKELEMAPEPAVHFSVSGFSNPYNYHLKINSDKKAHWRNNDSLFTIIHGDSPESRLRYLNYAELDSMVKYGINTISCTMYGDDLSDIHPYNAKVPNGYGDPTSGFNHAKLLSWRNYFLHFADITHGRYLVVALLSERLNHFYQTPAQAKTMIDTLNYYFGDLSIMWQREEFQLGHDDWINDVMGYLRQVDQLNLTSLHGLTHERPWTGHADIIDVAGLQASMSGADSRLRSIYASGFAVVAQEKTAGFGINDVADVRTWAHLGGGLPAGAGVYIYGYDVQEPTSQKVYQYRLLFKALAEELGGQPGPDTFPPPPPVGDFALWVSLSSNRSNPVALNGFSRSTTGNIYVFLSPTNQIAPNLPVKFYLDNTLTVSETGLPYDMKGGSASVASPYSATVGTHTVQAKNNSGQLLASGTFTIGGSSPPPPPDSLTLMVSLSSNRSNAVALNGYSSTGAKNIYMFLSPITKSVTNLPVRFYVNNTLKREETGLPYDFNGGNATTANPYFANKGTFLIQAKDGTGQLIRSATFTIN